MSTIEYPPIRFAHCTRQQLLTTCIALQDQRDTALAEVASLRAENEALLADPDWVTVAALRAEVDQAKRVRTASRTLADFLVRLPDQIRVMDEHNEGPAAAAIRLITELRAEVARKDAQIAGRAEHCIENDCVLPDRHTGNCITPLNLSTPTEGAEQ